MPRVTRASEIVVAPIADACFAIGRDVGRKDRPKWRLDGSAAGKSRAAVIGVTTAAIAGDRQIAAALDLREILPVTASQGRAERQPEGNSEQHGPSAQIYFR